MTASEVFRRILGAVEAYDSEGQFNVVDLATGWKVDLIMRRSRAFSRIDDAAGILRARSPELDASYLECWVQELGIEREWAAARRASVR